MLKRILVVAMFLTVAAFAQSGQSPLTPPKIQFFTDAGVVASGYKVCTYAAGTTTPLATYVTNNGVTNTNPVILDSAGRANIWPGSSAYKIVLMTPGTDNTCSTGSVVWSTDNVGAYCPLQGCTFTGNLLLSGNNYLQVVSSNSNAIVGGTSATSGEAGSFIASGNGNSIGVYAFASSATGVGVVGQSGGDIYQGLTEVGLNVFSVAHSGKIATSHGIAINGATEITAQSGTGGTVAMTASPTFTGTVTAAAVSALRVDYPRQAITLANGANNDIALNGAAFVKIAGPTGAFSISGFSGGEDGRILYVFNGVSQTMTITNNATSSAGNKITTLTGADVVLRANLPSFATFIYDTGSSTWILVSTN